MTASPRLWVELVRPASLPASGDPTRPNSTGPLTGRDRAVDAAGCIIAAALGALFISPTLRSGVEPFPTMRLVIDVGCGALALRGVVGLLREQQGQDSMPPAPQPTLSDIRRLVEETRRAGATIDFEMRLENPEALPSTLGRDAYRIVQESLTNIGKHASGTAARVRIAGAPDNGLHVSVRNRQPAHAQTGPTLPGSGAGLLGLQERVALAGGTLVHGPDGSGDFVVDAVPLW